MKYWFVVYQLHRTDSSKSNVDDTRTHNVILCDVHPLMWAANRSIIDFYGIITYVTFFTEIPEDVALDINVRNLISIER